MKLWDYLKNKFKFYKNRTAFAKSGLTYGDLLSLENSTHISRRLNLCEGNSREEQAIHIIKTIASGQPVVPVSIEYGLGRYQFIKNVVQSDMKEYKDLAFLMFTSGTTGVPKGVMLSDKNIIKNLEYISEYFNVNNVRSICIARPLVHIAVLTGELLYALIHGLTIYFYWLADTKDMYIR